MARINNGSPMGKVGRVVYSEWNGIGIVKAAPQRRKNSWTEPQLLHRQRFKAINDYCHKYKFTLIPQIWNQAAENGHGYNLFLKANAPAFALDGELSYIEKLHFSAGQLPLPQQLQAKRSEADPSKIVVTWVNDENLPWKYDDDELMVVACYPDHFTDPIATGVVRKTAKASIAMPEGTEQVTGIWIFFRADKKNEYSWDEYFKQ